MSAPGGRAFDRRETRLIGGFFAVALLLRVAVVLQPIEFADRLFVPDDTYYTLGVARSLAEGLGPSVDGRTPTNGFQPLLAFLEVPLFRASDSPDFALRGALLLSALAGAASVGLIGVLLLRLSGFAAALVGMACATLSPFLLRNDLNGLETSLAGALALLILIVTLRADAERTLRVRLVLGALCGAALLARVDTVFLVGLIGSLALRRWGVGGLWPVVASALLVVAPWWLYSLVHFGSVVPASGAAVHAVVAFHRALYLTWLHELDYGLNALALWLPADVLFGTGALSLLLGLVVVGGVVAFGLQARARGIGGTLLRVAALAALIHWLFYTFYLPAFWFHGRYFHFIGLLLCVLAGMAASRLMGGPDAGEGEPAADPGQRLPSGWPAQVAGIVALVYLTGALLGVGGLFARPSATVETGVRGAKGYRDVALFVRDRLPEGAVVAAMQSGALGFYAGDRFEVVNLDGVVNPDALAAVEDRDLQRVLRARGATHFVDWDVNVRMLGYAFGGRFDRRCLEVLFEAPPQGRHRFTAYALDRCLADPPPEDR